jgi:CRISPR/Cas system-associated protein Cas5 (RAMP superfamily)
MWIKNMWEKAEEQAKRIGWKGRLPQIVDAKTQNKKKEQQKETERERETKPGKISHNNADVYCSTRKNEKRKTIASMRKFSH